MSSRSPRAKVPLCEAQSFPKWKVRGNAERLKWQEMSRSEKWMSKSKAKCAGGKFCFCSANVFEIRRCLGFRPAGECGRNAGRAFWILVEGAITKEIQIW